MSVRTDIQIEKPTPAAKQDPISQRNAKHNRNRNNQRNQAQQTAKDLSIAATAGHSSTETTEVPAPEPTPAVVETPQPEPVMLNGVPLTVSELAPVQDEQRPVLDGDKVTGIVLPYDMATQQQIEQHYAEQEAAAETAPAHPEDLRILQTVIRTGENCDLISKSLPDIEWEVRNWYGRVENRVEAGRELSEGDLKLVDSFIRSLSPTQVELFHLIALGSAPALRDTSKAPLFERKVNPQQHIYMSFAVMNAGFKLAANRAAEQKKAADIQAAKIQEGLKLLAERDGTPIPETIEAVQVNDHVEYMHREIPATEVPHLEQPAAKSGFLHGLMSKKVLGLTLTEIAAVAVTGVVGVGVISSSTGGSTFNAGRFNL